VVLLSFIVMALMAVFNSTQTAFRASITQTDVLEGGRAAMGLIKGDLETMAPSFGRTNRDVAGVVWSGAANFCANSNSSFAPLVQSLAGSGSNARRVNVLQNFFILGRANLNGQDSWIGTGYAVAGSVDGIYSLYRFSVNHPVMSWNPVYIFTNEFNNFLLAITNGSRLMDGVVHLTVRPYDLNGRWMTNTYVYDAGAICIGTNRNVWFGAPAWGEVGFCMYSNTLPAAVDIELGVLEDRAIQRAESLPDGVAAFWARSNYLAQQAGKVHLFRQRIPIRNVDPSAYP
jgi:hypothetical protein